MNNFDPSSAPNGDFIREISYTYDAKFVVVLFQHSDNLYLYNASTYEVEHVIDLGPGAYGYGSDK